MVEGLGGQCPGLFRRPRHRRDPGGRLHQAVEAAPLAPRPVRAPCRQLRHDQSGPPLHQRLGRETEPVQGARPVPGDDHVGRREQLLEGPPVPRQVQGRGPLPEPRVGVLVGEFGATRGIDAQDVGAQQGEGAGGDRARDDPGQVQDPYPGGGQQGSGLQRRQRTRACRVQALALDQGPPSHRDRLRMGRPLLGRAHRHGESSGRVHGLLDVQGRPLGQRPFHPGLGHAQRAQQPLAVVGIVRVGPHPPVRRPPEPRQRGEGDRSASVDQQMPFAHERRGDGTVVHHDLRHLPQPGPHRPQFGAGQRARAHTRACQLPHGKAPRKSALPHHHLDVGHDCTMQY